MPFWLGFRSQGSTFLRSQGRVHSRVRDFRRSGPEGSRFWHTDGCGAPQGSTFSPFDARGFEILCAPAVLCIPGFEILGLDRRKFEPCDENPPRARAQKIWKISGPKKSGEFVVRLLSIFLGFAQLVGSCPSGWVFARRVRLFLRSQGRVHLRVGDFRRSGPDGSRFWHTDVCGAPQGSTFSPFDARGFEILCVPAVLCIPGF